MTGWIENGEIGSSVRAKLNTLHGVGGSDATISSETGGNINIASGSGLVFLNLPTSDPSISGAAWNNAGTVKISTGAPTIPDWVPANAKVHIDFIGNRAWSNGTEVAIDTLLTNAVLDSNGLLFTGSGAVVTVTPNLLAALQLPYSVVFDQNYSTDHTLSDHTTMYIFGTDGNHYGYVSGNEVSITTDDYDVQYLAGHVGDPNQSQSGKIAGTVSNTKCAVSVNGDATVSDASQTLSFGNVTSVSIWSSTGFGQVADGHIRSITIYPVQSDSALSQLSQVG